MLQQTTVAAAIPYFNRWMAQFPTVSALASAPIDSVLLLWSGLGYYARARNIHRTAQIVENRFIGIIPSDPHELLSLPGIGPYTAGAIRSLAFEHDAPLVDVNVIRVLCRIFGLRGNPKTDVKLTNHVWKLSEAAIPAGQARNFNQSLMELGALVCVPKAPKCSTCPARMLCNAYESGIPESFPQEPVAKIWKYETHLSLIATANEDLVLMSKRSQHEALWGGLWEFPRCIVKPEDDILGTAELMFCKLFDRSPAAPSFVGKVRHVVANRKTVLLGYQAFASSSELNACAEYDELRWVPMRLLHTYAMASPQRRLFEVFTASRTQEILELQI